LAGDKKGDDELKKGLKDSFPASDPPSNTQPPNRSRTPASKEHLMGIAKYQIFGTGGAWRVRHDGKAENEYATKEAAFEAAIAAASLALREGHEVTVTAPASE